MNTLAWFFFLPVALIYSLRRVQDRQALKQRLGSGLFSIRFPEGCFWLHACSVGEVNSLLPLIAELESKGIPITLTVITSTGFQRARELWPEIPVFLMPFDLFSPLLILRNRKELRAMFLMETEIWPGMIACCTLCSIPVSLINGRISDRSLPKYKKISWLLSPILNQLERVFAQSETDRERLRAIGRTLDIELMPNLKFWSVKVGSPPNKTFFPDDSPYFVAGSTHEGEDELIIRAYMEIKSRVKNLRLVIAPRHLSRVEKISQLLKARKLPFSLKTLQISPSEVTILNTIGELQNFYLLPGIVFMGGSLVKSGGHNPLEPLYAGKIPFTGPHTQNFKDIIRTLKSENLIIQVNTSRELAEKAGAALLRNTDDTVKIREFFRKIEKDRQSLLKKILP
ncbi:MAG: glycosyltransferase N-terminal domain-containing protein [Candidatus Wallbacteria bacterium]|nr:glycosyltransferase N-terminal domain-containing protein [Candidatus Wallbacteria bacterium]